MFFEKPENTKHLPSSASPIIWGYEADHPFDEESRNVLLWIQFFGSSEHNYMARCPDGGIRFVKTLARLAIMQETSSGGILLTSWGDCGNHNPEPLPPLFLAAELVWNGRRL